MVFFCRGVNNTSEDTSVHSPYPPQTTHPGMTKSFHSIFSQVTCALSTISLSRPIYPLYTSYSVALQYFCRTHTAGQFFKQKFHWEMVKQKLPILLLSQRAINSDLKHFLKTFLKSGAKKKVINTHRWQ